MKFKIIATLLLLVTVYMSSSAQGVSISVLIPKNGYLSTPVSPLSIRGLGYNWGAIGFATGGSLYNMPGLPMSNIPFANDKPLTGPHWSILVPLQLTLEFHSKTVSVRFLGGGFGMVHLFPQLNYGNVDRAIADYEDWEVANADFDLKSKPGGGWMAGVEFIFHVNRKYSITTEVQYLSGQSKIELNGSYIGGNSSIEEKQVNYPNAQVLLEGVEISLGLNFN